MGRLCWCIGKKSDVPYWIDAFQVSIYSMEELCYLIRKRTPLIDKSLMDEELLNYIDRELLLETGELKRLIHFGGSLSTFCQMLLDLGQCSVSQQEWEQIRKILIENETLTPFERKEKQADTMLENGSYFAAFHAYGSLTLQTDGPRQRARLYGQMAKAAFYLFHYQTAAEFFQKSCELLENDDMRRGYFLCMRFLMDKQEYIQYTTRKQTDYEISLQVEQLFEDARRSAQERTDAIGTVGDRQTLIKKFQEMME